jgi:DNA-binding HxlR family transcriptional regulator
MSSARRPNPVTGCPLTAALAAVGGKWKLIIVYWLAEEPRHFAALGRLTGDISQKVLTQQLRELVADGIVERNRTGAVPAPVIYSLSDYGRSLLPLVDLVKTWGRGHLSRLQELPAPVRRNGAGRGGADSSRSAGPRQTAQAPRSS